MRFCIGAEENRRGNRKNADGEEVRIGVPVRRGEARRRYSFSGCRYISSQMRLENSPGFSSDMPPMSRACPYRSLAYFFSVS